ncbi:hypothetical protein PENG_38 [Klebsiella phage vB_KpnS_Penguinator]|uniref:Uncharacterized protein n=1 Tax=Klebsiella phage vB_KpnS_Penguinator TaxID=2591377 RepID=A0A5B9NKM4_9CAUD|nr:hypothetical protein PENG_38 [Klebsiella phage vB_KpnS_Penguinator]
MLRMRYIAILITAVVLTIAIFNYAIQLG